MKSLISGVFTLLMCAIIAVVIYFIFFGQSSTGWKGAIYFAGENVEEATAEYYYSYCYLPAMYKTLSIDKALGGAQVETNLFNTKANLSGDYDTIQFYDLQNLDGQTVYHYSTGWVQGK